MSYINTRIRYWKATNFPKAGTTIDEQELIINMERFKYEQERVKNCMVEWIVSKKDIEILKKVISTSYPQYLDMLNTLIVLK